ncbi:hypothetical protein CapIbe_008880 [Capra ibex]
MQGNCKGLVLLKARARLPHGQVLKQSSAEAATVFWPVPVGSAAAASESRAALGRTFILDAESSPLILLRFVGPVRRAVPWRGSLPSGKKDNKTIETS